MFLKAVLKKPWSSKRGKLYPAGTVFVFEERYLETDSALYSYKIPGVCYGIVVIPNSSFKLMTAEERLQREKRKKAYEDHMKSCKDQFIRGKT